MVLFAIQDAEMDTTELVQFAGNLALQASEMMEPFALSHHHMEEVLDILFGVEIDVNAITETQVAKEMAPSTIQDAELVSVLSDAVSALLFALLE